MNIYDEMRNVVLKIEDIYDRVEEMGDTKKAVVLQEKLAMMAKIGIDLCDLLAFVLYEEKKGGC